MRRVLAGALAALMLTGTVATSASAGASTTAEAAAVLGDTLAVQGTMQADDALAIGGWAFVMQADGNAVVYANGRAQFSTGTGGNPGSRAVLQGDGNFVVYSATNRPLFQTGTGGRGAQLLRMQADGNLVLLDGEGRPSWSRTTGTIPPPAPAPVPTTVVGTELGSGARLGSNQALAIGGWAAVMQPDGNLVVNANGRPQWSSGTGGNPGATALMQTDGNLVVYSASGRPLFNTGTGRYAGGRLVLQGDGNLVVVKPDGFPSWSRTTGRVFSDKGWTLDGLAITPDFEDDFFADAIVRNAGTTTRTGTFTITLFRGGVPLVTFDFYADSWAPGRTEILSSYSFTDYGPFDDFVFYTDYTTP